MDKLKNLILTSDQVKVIEDLINKGAVVEIIDQKADVKIVIKRDNNVSEKRDILKLSPEFHGVGVNLKELWRKVRKKG